MSIKKDSDTRWTLTTPAGERNIDLDIEVTPHGLEIDGDLIPWDEIDAARVQAAGRGEWVFGS